MGKLKSQGKPFDISKWTVWEAFRQVKVNKGGQEWMVSPSPASRPI
jgi:hypothetical protein